MFERQLATAARRAEVDPTGLSHEELCLMVEYAMVNGALGCGNYVDDALELEVDRPFGFGRPAPPPVARAIGVVEEQVCLRSG